MTLALAVLGDSIAFGLGAAHPDDTVGSRLAAALTRAGTPTVVRVFAVSGARSDALAAQAAGAVAWRADVALIIIGANDLTHFVPAELAATQLGGAVRALRAAGSQVVVCPAPDLSVVPWVPPNMRALVRAASAQLRQAQTIAASAAGARIAEIQSESDAASAADLRLFSADRFHPLSAGYAVIADALGPAVSAAAEAVSGQI